MKTIIIDNWEISLYFPFNFEILVVLAYLDGGYSKPMDPTWHELRLRAYNSC